MKKIVALFQLCILLLQSSLPLLISIVSLLPAIIPQSAHAAGNTYYICGGGDFYTPSDWWDEPTCSSGTNGTLPDSTDNLVINGAVSMMDFTVDSGGTLVINAYDSIDVGSVLTVNSGGVVTVNSGGTLVVKNVSNLVVNSGGVVNVNNGGNLNVDYANLDVNGGNLNISGGILNINGSPLNINVGNLSVNSGGIVNINISSTLTVDTGSIFTVNTGTINVNSSLIINGSSLTLNNSTLSVDYGGSVNANTGADVKVNTGSTVSIDNMTSFVIDNASIMDVDNSSTLTVSNMSTLYVQWSLIVSCSGWTFNQDSDFALDGTFNGNFTSGGITYGSGTHNACPPVVNPANDFVTTWKTDNAWSSNSTSITIPTTGGGYSYDVDWNNDGTFDQFGVTGNVTHDYGVAGTYTVRIRWAFPIIYFNNEWDKLKILSVDQWGNNPWVSMEKAFYGASNFTITAVDSPVLTGVTDMSYMFANTTTFNSDISAWNTSSVIDMSGMFSGATTFNSDISAWNTSSVIDMSSMFLGATAFNQPLNSWNTSSVTKMSAMFASATAFNQPLNSWNTSSVTKMTTMFNGATAFNSNISTWNTSAVTDMYFMFSNATAFNSDISAWNTSAVTNIGGMFQGATAFDKPLTFDDNGTVWNTSDDKWNTSAVTNMNAVFSNATAFNQPLNSWNTSAVTNMSYMFADAAAFNSNISAWNTSAVTNMYYMFANATAFNSNISTWNTSAVTNMGSMFQNVTDFNSDISAWDTSAVTSMTYMFYGTTAFNSDISTWNTSAVTDMSGMFGSATGFKQDISAWDINQVMNFASMFADSDINAPSTTTNYDALLASWSTQGVLANKSFSGGLSKYCDQASRDILTNAPSNWTITDGGKGSCTDTTNFVTTWKTDNAGSSNSTSITISTAGAGYNYDVDWNNDGTFDQFGITGTVTHDYGVAGTYTVRIRGAFPRIYLGWLGDKLKILSVDQWWTNAWTSMEHAFSGASNLTITATDSPVLTGVTNMSNMFRGATSLNQDISAWNTSTVTNMSYMFYDATAFNKPLNSWNTSAVTNMSYMFRGATSLNQDISAWNTSAVTNMSNMFNGATAFNQDISAWNTSAVTDMSFMFLHASVFNQDISAWNTSAVTNMAFMFYGATPFNQPLNSWDTSAVTDMSFMLRATAFNQPLNSWNTSAVMNMAGMFNSATAFKQDISSWDTSAVMNMSEMFLGATAFNQPLNSWDTSKVKFMNHMFYGATAFNQPLNSWDTSALTNAQAMFFLASAFNQPLNSWDTSSITNMNEMFSSAYIFNSDISTWDTSAVTNMGKMFLYAYTFNQPLNSWDTSSVTNMSQMFSGSSFKQDISGWDINQVTNFTNMFAGVNINAVGTTTNYDSLLASWSAQAPLSGMFFHGGSSKFCDQDSRDILTGTYTWTITDGWVDGVLCDTTAPTITSVTSVTGNGTRGVGGVVSIQVAFDEIVTVTGFPQITLETGTTDAVVDYVSGTGSNTLTFTYTIAAGQNSSDLDYTTTGALTLNGGTIRDAALNNATLTLPAPGAVNSLGANKALVVDTAGPTVSSVTASTANGYYNAGDVIDVQVIFDEIVTVTGFPQITLETGATDAVVDYVSGTGSNTLVFSYTIAAGQNSSDLDYVNIASLVFNGGTIVDGASNSATLTLPTPGAAGSLGVNKALVVDTIAPGILTSGALTTASDTGFANNDNITNDVTPTIEGIGVEANATVKIYLDGITLVCTTTADALGAWSCTIPVALTSGTNNIYGSQTDLAGNESTISWPLPIVIDIDDATGSFSTPTFLTNNPAAQQLTFTVADTAIGGGIRSAANIVVSSSVSGVLVASCTPAVAFPTTTDELVTCTVDISAEWTHVMTVDVTDLAGNTNSFISPNYVFDFTAPLFTSLTVDATTLTPLDFTDPDISFSATDGVAIDHYEMDVNGGGFSTVTSPQSIVASDSTLNTVTVRAYDTAGNMSTIAISFYPIVIINSPTVLSNTSITNTTIEVVGPNPITDVSGVALSCFTDNTYTTPVPLPDPGATDSNIFCKLDSPITASTTLTINGADAFLSGATTSRSYIIETLLPTITPTRPTTISQATITDSSFVIADANGISIVTFTGVGNTLSCLPLVPTATASTTCTGTITASGTLTVDFTDGAGNNNSATYAYFVDPDDATISALSPAAGLFNAGQAVSFTVEDLNSGIIPANVIITGGTSPSCSVVDANHVSCTVNANTSTTIEIAATDNAGNIANSGPHTYDIDTVSPTISSVTSSTANGTYKIGDVIDIQVVFDENVIVDTAGGTPQITLETGTTDTPVNYTSGTGTNTLTFQYTMGAGDISADLDYTNTTALSLNGGTIRDAALNNATLTLPAPGAAGSLGNNKALVVDGVVPQVTNITSLTADGAYDVNDVISIQITFDEIVNITGTPQLILETGTIDTPVDYVSGSGTNTLTFTYTVAVGQNNNDLDYVDVNSLILNSGTIKDVALNDATLTLPAPGAAGSLGNNKALFVDSAPPNVSAVSSSTLDGNYKIGDVISIQILFDEVVYTTGTPQLTLETGSTDAVVNYASGSGTNTLTFTYTVAAGEETPDLDYTGTTALALNGGSIKDLFGHDGILTLSAPGAIGSLGNSHAFLIDGIVPTVTLTTPSFTVNAPFTVTAQWSETVTGFDVTDIDIGNWVASSFTAVDGDTYTFLVTPTVDGAVTVDIAASKAIDIVSQDNTSATQLSVTIDSTAPTITNVTSMNPNGTYKTGNVIGIRLSFDEIVSVNTVGGIPTLTLETGTIDAVINYVSWSGTNELLFNYTINAGDESLDLDYATFASLLLNGWSIHDVYLNNANLLLPIPGALNSLSVNKNIIIDTIAPADPTVAPDLLDASDTGTNTTDNLTSDTTPSLSVECSEIDAIISLYSDIPAPLTLVGTHTCLTATTLENLTVAPTTLTDGIHNLTYIIRDPSGNASAESPALAITIDATADAAPGTPDMDTSSDTGSSSTDNITSNTTPDFTMSCVTGSTVTLYDGATSLTSAICAAGTVTLTASTLSEGVHATINAKQTDESGNISVASGNLSVTIDTTADAAPGAPDMTAGTDTGSSNTDNNTSDTTPNFAISCTSGSLVKLYSGVTQLASGTCGGGGTITLTSSALTEGAYSITAQQTDKAGNVSAFSTPILAIIIDTTAPLTPGSAPDMQAASDTGVSDTDNNTSDTTPTFDIVCSIIGSKITLRIWGVANATHTCTAVGVETITSTAQVSGTYVYSYTESDLAGNVSVASGDLTITIDATADAAPGTPDMNTSSDTGSSSTDNITSNTTPDFTMSCVTGSTVTLYDGATSLTSAICVAGTVTLTASTLSEGVHATINAKQTDESGNISVASGNLSVTIDTTAYGTPTAPDLQAGSDLGASPTDNITSGTTPMIDIDCPAIGAVMNVYSDNPASNTLIATHTCLAAGIESVTTSVLWNGVHAVTVSSTDEAGNVSNISNNLDITIDTLPPVLTGATVQGTTITMTYDDTMDSTSLPDVGDFVISWGHSVTAVSISGTQIILTTGNASTYGESLALGYTPGLNPIRDRSFNDAISFTGYAILNMNISSSGGSSGGRVTPLTTAGNPTANYPMECPRNTSGNVYRKNTLDYNPQTFLDFANNLVLEGFITRQDNVNEYRFTDKMLRKDALRIGVKMKRNKGEDVGLVSPQKYTKIYSDIDYTSTSWLPGTIETGLAYDLISKERETFEQNRSVTRSETYAMIMKSVCMLGHTSSSLVDWQYNVYNIASSNGLTIRSWSDFEPNREILTQEIFVLASRAADWAEKTGGCNPLPKQCLLP